MVLHMELKKKTHDNSCRKSDKNPTCLYDESPEDYKAGWNISQHNKSYSQPKLSS